MLEPVKPHKSVGVRSDRSYMVQEVKIHDRNQARVRFCARKCIKSTTSELPLLVRGYSPRDSVLQEVCKPGASRERVTFDKHDVEKSVLGLASGIGVCMTLNSLCTFIPKYPEPTIKKSKLKRLSRGIRSCILDADFCLRTLALL